jgi:uncharacterized protein YlxW (UPF0749 family)
MLLLGFLFTIQIRSQASAQRYLSGQDNTSLALLITGLSQANNRLVQAQVDANDQQNRLLADLGSNDQSAPALQRQLTQLQIINGSVAVHGPGVRLSIGFKLQSFELQDLANVLRQLGAEAVAIDAHRVVASTVIADANGAATIDGEKATTPYTLLAIGDPTALEAGAKEIVGTLSPRGSVVLVTESDIHISAVSKAGPIVYSSYGG